MIKRTFTTGLLAVCLLAAAALQGHAQLFMKASTNDATYGQLRWPNVTNFVTGNFDSNVFAVGSDGKAMLSTNLVEITNGVANFRARIFTNGAALAAGGGGTGGVLPLFQDVSTTNYVVPLNDYGSVILSVQTTNSGVTVRAPSATRAGWAYLMVSNDTSGGETSSLPDIVAGDLRLRGAGGLFGFGSYVDAGIITCTPVGFSDGYYKWNTPDGVFGIYQFWWDGTNAGFSASTPTGFATSAGDLTSITSGNPVSETPSGDTVITNIVSATGASISVVVGTNTMTIASHTTGEYMLFAKGTNWSNQTPGSEAPGFSAHVYYYDQNDEVNYELIFDSNGKLQSKTEW